MIRDPLPPRDSKFVRGAERFYAANVLQTKGKDFFARNGFVRTEDDPDWWIMRKIL